MNVKFFVYSTFCLLLLSACGAIDNSHSAYDEANTGYGKNSGPVGLSDDTVSGDGGILTLFGGDREKSRGGSGIGVNSYLWRASLATLSFMPLSSADPFGGVIITDWFTPPETLGERFKMNVYILGQQLRADGVVVAVFRQSRKGDDWVDASVKKTTSVNLENKILSQARKLRFAARVDTN